MNNLEQVDILREQMIAEGVPKPDCIRQLALACLDWPYVFGAWGEQCTPANRKRRARADHPTITTKCPALNGKTCGDCKWGAGVRMYDCRGFTAWLVRQVDLDITGQGATSQYNTAANWVRRGPVSEMPDCVCCVFRQKNGKMEHTGMHLGGGVVVDCSVNVRSVGMSGWTHYAIPAGLYSKEEIPVETVKPILRRGSRGDNVRELQRQLTDLGYSCGVADGVFGAKTETAVKDFQRDHGLKADGIVGPLTWAAIDEALGAVEAPPEQVEPETFRVTIDGVTYEQYRRILDICPLAEAVRE